MTIYPSADDILSKEFLNNYVGRQPDWGFNGLGYIVYKRTYARPILDASGKEVRKEEWWETCERCVRGMQRVGAKYTHEEAERMYDYMFNLKCFPSGRGLWQLGTTLVDEIGLMDSLLNCWGTKTSEIEDFCFIFMESMFGGGVGPNVSKEFTFELPRVKRNVRCVLKNTKDAEFIVPDSKEGWCDLWRKLLEAYLVTGKSFTYSTVCIRSEGEPLKTFGGIAPGPRPLIKGAELLCELLENREGKKLRTCDVCDIICIGGEIVKSGGIRRCLPENSLVHTELGLVPIQKISVGDRVLTQNGYEPVIDFVYQGKQSIIKINTQDGWFECTPDHRMAVLRNFEIIWTKANELVEGDVLLTSRESIEGQSTRLPDFNYDKPIHSTTCTDITIPKLDEDMAWFIGAFQADGYVYWKPDDTNARGEISGVFGIDEYDIAEKFQQQLERFGINSSLKKRKNESSWIVTAKSRQLGEYLTRHIKQPNSEIVIPEFILKASTDIKMSYCSGLFDGDGCWSNRPVSLCTSVYGNFIRNLQTLLYSCGISTRISVRKSEFCPSRKNWQDLYSLNLINNVDKELWNSFYNGLKPIISIGKTQYGNGFPSHWLKSYNIYRSNHKQVTLDKYINCINKDITYTPVLVVGIENLEEKETYDICVENNHNFYCNGYLTHNTALCLQGDPDDTQFLMLKRWDLGSIPYYRSNSNNSIIAPSYDHIIDKFWQGYKGNGECYGLLNLTNARKFGRIGETKWGNFSLGEPNLIAGNPCMEALLCDGEPCNLAELVANRMASLKEFIDAAILMYKYQKAVCAGNYYHDKTNKVVHKNMKIGLGVTGICQRISVVDEWLDQAYTALREFDKQWSEENGLNQSIRLTVAKPSGTLSLLSGSTPGAHSGFSRFHIRRVRFGSNDPLIPVLKELGVNLEYEIGLDGSIRHDVLVAEFPASFDENTIVSNNFSATDQLNLIKKLQQVWADQSVSVTVYFDKNNLSEIQDWLKENYNDYIKTVSFLPREDHGFAQAPLEEITEEQYNTMVSKMKPISSIINANFGDELLEMECANGVCPIR